MNFSETFIRRPIATSLMMAAIALFGLVAYRSLPVSDLPNVDFPTLLVTASLPGASPETMASAVATPLENQFSNISGLDSMTSTNSLGSTQVTLEFVLSKSLDGAAVDVQSAITQAARLLPQGMPTPPTFTKVNPADQPILYLAITSQTLPLWTLDEYAETRIAQRISMVSGVAQVQVLGAQKYAVHVQVDPHLLASRQIGINEVRDRAVRAGTSTCPPAASSGRSALSRCRPPGQLMSAAQYRPLIVAYRNGSPVRLEELGNVIDSVEDDKTASWFYTKQGTQRAIILGVQRQPGTNTIAVTDAVKNLLPTFRSEIPASVKMDILYDRSDTIRESYKDVQFTMLLTLGLVVMVIFLFLRNVSATVIPALALPFSIIGTFAIMYLLHYSLDNLSMMALDPFGRLRRRRRHRDARKHFPPHGDGRKAVVRGSGGIERNRVHHRFDDAVARGRVHSGAVPGRHSRPAVPRIFGHHLRRDSDFGHCVRDAHAHAVLPLPALARRAEAILVLSHHRAVL